MCRSIHELTVFIVNEVEYDHIDTDDCEEHKRMCLGEAENSITNKEHNECHRDRESSAHMPQEA